LVDWFEITGDGCPSKHWQKGLSQNAHKSHPQCQKEMLAVIIIDNDILLFITT
jgi:hypothetical protein